MDMEIDETPAAAVPVETNDQITEDSNVTDQDTGMKTADLPEDDDSSVADGKPEDSDELSRSSKERKASRTRGKRKIVVDDEEDEVEATLAENEDEDVPLIKKLKTSETTSVKVKAEPVSSSPMKRSSSRLRSRSASAASMRDQDSDSEDEPLIRKAKPAPKKSRGKSRAPSKIQEEDEEEFSAGSSSPVPTKSRRKGGAKVKKEDDDDEEEEKPKPKVSAKPKAKGKTKVKSESEADVADKKPNADAEDEEEEYKWWLDQDRDESVKWETLEHNGPYFPPPYEPHGVKMKYDGKEVELEPAAEEVAGFFAQLLGTDWAENPRFQANFFKDFKDVLAKCENPPPIKEFKLCDFTPIAEHFNRLKEERKNMSKEEKEKAKAEKKALEDKYGWAILNGRREKIGNFRIEPPSLFRGRGEHPKTGSLKKRIVPEDITINIGKDAKVPEPPAGHQWGKVIHDNTVSWLTMWRENVNDNFKYVFLAANSSLKGQSDMKKFEKARELKNHVERIRDDYTRELKDKQMVVRQRATAMYLIDRFALRAGNEKGDDEADTVGCCSLRFEHITLEPPNKVIFDFLGKDSIRYYNEVEVDERVFKNLKIFKKEPKSEGDDLFDRLTTSSLNKHLNTYMAGLTAKVFRTYNASWTFQRELEKTPADATVAEKILAYNRANRQVAILCNHQRSVPKSHSNSMAKMEEKIKAQKYHLREIKEIMLENDPKLKKKRPELTEPESDLDDDFVSKYEAELAEKEKEKLIKKLEKENEKRKEEGKKLLKLEDIEGKSSTQNKREWSMERLEKEYSRIEEKIKALKMQRLDKDENKTTALGTSKINYIDPRISASWCKKHSVPIEKIFPKTLREKFKWSLDVEESWEF